MENNLEMMEMEVMETEETANELALVEGSETSGGKGLTALLIGGAIAGTALVVGAVKKHRDKKKDEEPKPKKEKKQKTKLKLVRVPVEDEAIEELVEEFEEADE